MVKPPGRSMCPRLSIKAPQTRKISDVQILLSFSFSVTQEKKSNPANRYAPKIDAPMRNLAVTDSPACEVGSIGYQQNHELK